MDMTPVSSETIMVMLSDTEDMPSPALCLVPSSRATAISSTRGRMQAAATISLLRIIIAPSCSGVLGSNMFSIRGAEMRPSISVPVFIISPRPVRCSITISAPTLRLARSVIA